MSASVSHWHTPSSPLPQLVREYQQALASEQHASAIIEDLHREIAELVQLQTSLESSDSRRESSSRSPARTAQHAPSDLLAQSQLQVLFLTLR